MWDYVEHVPDPAANLENAFDVLKPGAYLALSTGDVEEEGTVSGQISSGESDGDDTDSIVTDLGDDEATTQQDRTTTEDGLEVVEN